VLRREFLLFSFAVVCLRKEISATKKVMRMICLCAMILLPALSIAGERFDGNWPGGSPLHL
jgi:hypothetical protein